MNHESSSYSHSNSLDYAQHQTSVSIVPRLSAPPKYVSFRLCQSFRKRDSSICVTVFESDTLEQLKEQIWKQLSLTTKPKDFSLTKFNEAEHRWIPIDNTNVLKTIIVLNIPPRSILNVEPYEETKLDQQNTHILRDSDLILKLCTRPMNRTDFNYLDIHSSVTIEQLKEVARKQVKSRKTDHLYWWTNNKWSKLETNPDDFTLVEIGLNQYSEISFEMENNPIPGVCGLTNLGNTCFMNSALQCLSNIPELTQKILSFDNEINAPIIGAYSALIKNMWSGEHIVTAPSSLLVSVRENLPRFSRYRQQDAHEFMNYFLHLIHEEFTNDKTLITDFFYGRIQRSVKCQGACRFVETNEETISFLPLPIDNDINQYQILYLRSNGEYRIVSVRSCARTIDKLIESFIEQHEPALLFQRIKAVRIVDNRIKDIFSSYIYFNNTTKSQLTFIEVPEKFNRQKYIEFVFLNQKTNTAFRPSVLVVCPFYDCRYSDLSEQLDQIKNYLCKITGAPFSASNLSWINDEGMIRQLNIETKENETLRFMDRIIVEMDPEWIEKYINQCSFNHSADKASLNSLLTDFFHEESLNGDYYCSKCLDLKTATEKADLALPLPPVLIIQLKRFTYDTYSDEKIDTCIKFPLRDLDLRQYIIQNDKENINVSTLYDLVAVSNHTGSLVSGHYTTYAKNNGNKQWYSFNDEIFREIDENDVVTKNAYILVYVKRTVC